MWTGRIVAAATHDELEENNEGNEFPLVRNLSDATCCHHTLQRVPIFHSYRIPRSIKHISIRMQRDKFFWEARIKSPDLITATGPVSWRNRFSYLSHLPLFHISVSGLAATVGKAGNSGLAATVGKAGKVNSFHRSRTPPNQYLHNFFLTPHALSP